MIQYPEIGQMDIIMEQSLGVIHDIMVIFGVPTEDHDANLINLSDMCQTEGLELNSKKLELHCDRVVYFGAAYSTDASRP